jgi:hypothetical protein
MFGVMWPTAPAPPQGGVAAAHEIVHGVRLNVGRDRRSRFEDRQFIGRRIRASRIRCSGIAAAGVRSSGVAAACVGPSGIA